VDAYVDDPDCGFVFTAGGFVDLLKGVAAVNSDRVVSRVPKDLPIHLAAGDQDPVGRQGKGVHEVADRFRRHGVSDVTVKLWPGARHEILNETNRDEVEAELVDWLDAHLPARTSES
jgi:alpha-beta hydrolase superfamily lysophospholipase